MRVPSRQFLIGMLILCMTLGLSGCVTISPSQPAPEPLQPEDVPESPQPEAPAPELPPPGVPASGVPQPTVIELPSEVHVGEYITVRVKVLEEGKYNLQIAEEHPDLGGIGIYYTDLGVAAPDDNLVVCWHALVPVEGRGDWQIPGNYKIVIFGQSESGDFDVLLLERNIIIKE